MSCEQKTYLFGPYHVRDVKPDAYLVEFPKQNKSDAIFTPLEKTLPPLEAGETATLFDCYVVGEYKLEVETNSICLYSVRRKLPRKPVAPAHPVCQADIPQSPPSSAKVPGEAPVTPPTPKTTQPPYTSAPTSVEKSQRARRKLFPMPSPFHGMPLTAPKPRAKKQKLDLGQQENPAPDVDSEDYDSCDSFIDNRPEDQLSSYESDTVHITASKQSETETRKQKKSLRGKRRIVVESDEDDFQDKKHNDKSDSHPNAGFAESATMKRLQKITHTYNITDEDIARQMRLFQRKLPTAEMRLNWSDPTVALAWLLVERVPDMRDVISLQERSSQWERFSDAAICLDEVGQVIGKDRPFRLAFYLALPFSGVVLDVEKDPNDAILLFYATEPTKNTSQQERKYVNEIEFAPGEVEACTDQHEGKIQYRWLPTWEQYAKNESLYDGEEPSSLPASAVFARLSLLPWPLRVAFAPNYNTSMHAHERKYPRRIDTKSVANVVEVHDMLELYYANIKQVWRTSLGTHIRETYLLPFKNFGQRADKDIYAMLEDLGCNKEGPFEEDVINPVENARCDACLLQRTLSVQCVGVTSGKTYKIGCECAERLRYLAAITDSILKFRAMPDYIVAFGLIDSMDTARDMFLEQQRMHQNRR